MYWNSIIYSTVLVFTDQIAYCCIRPVTHWKSKCEFSVIERDFSCFTLTASLYFCSLGPACLLRLKIITSSTTFENFLVSEFCCCYLDMLTLLCIKWTTVCIIIFLLQSHFYLSLRVSSCNSVWQKMFQWTLGSTSILKFGDRSGEDSN